MNRLHSKPIIYRVVLSVSVILSPVYSPMLNAASGDVDSPRIKTSINQGWQYHLGETPGEPWRTDFDASDWEIVNVPHSLKLTTLDLDGSLEDWYQPDFHRDFGWYRKMIRPGRSSKVFLEFEGAHQVTDLWVNGQHVGQHSVGGFTPFHFDITDFVNHGEDNLVCLKVDNRKRQDTPPDPGPFDYLKFSGLYRDVYLVETDPVHITFNWEDINAGIRITTPTVDPLNMNATINVETSVRNETSGPVKCTVISRIIDAEGLVVLKMKQDATIVPGADFLYNQCSGIEENLRLWSIDDPYLYRVNSEVLVDGKTVDCLENRMGVRKIELNMQQGFLLNGEPVEFVGLNRHQQYPYIGDAVPDALHYKDVKQLKDLGYNTIRTAHYPQDNALMEACDELGILAYEEPPTWIGVGDAAWFENYREATRRMVRNHRNHPSLVVWGAGINHRGAVPEAHYILKQEDPSRFTATNNAEWTGVQASGPCDIFSNMDYKGIPDWKQDEYLLAMEGGGGPAVISKYKSDPLRLGMITWTAHAYYTFHNNAPGKKERIRGGEMDIFRIPKARNKGVAWYRSEAAKVPVVYFTSDWTPDLLELTVYSNCDEVRLMVNGKEFARQKPDARAEYAGIKSPPFTFVINDYEPGTLKAEGLIEGKVAVSYEARTPEKASAIHLVADLDGREFTADGSDILMVHAKIVDQNGTMIRFEEHEVEFSVEGPASILGDAEGVGTNPMHSRYGIAPLMLRAGTEAGEIKISAKARGLKAAGMTLTSKKYNPVVEIEAYTDPGTIQVDLGGEGQILQYGWIPWTGTKENLPDREFNELGGFTAGIGPASNGSIRCFGEINVYGTFGFAIGEGVLVNDEKGLEITFTGLEKGNYRLKTWHYSPMASTNDHDPVFEKWNEEGLNDIPYSESLEIDNGAGKTTRVPVGRGNDLTKSRAGIARTDFSSDGENPVKILIMPAGSEKGIWLNCFELGRAAK